MITDTGMEEFQQSQRSNSQDSFRQDSNFQHHFSEEPISQQPTPQESATAPPVAMSSSENESSSNAKTTKRKTTAGKFDEDGNPRPTKKRSSKACQNCRNRKVRCDLMQKYHVDEHGAVLCSNCAIDKIPCLVTESKRRKKNRETQWAGASGKPPFETNAGRIYVDGATKTAEIHNEDGRRFSESSAMSIEAGNNFVQPQHAPHSHYQTANHQMNQGELIRRQSSIPRPSSFDPDPTYALLASASMTGDLTRARLTSSSPPVLKHHLPGYIKPLPQKMTSIDIDYLYGKGALSVPEDSMRSALLCAYIEYVHPYMPLLDLNETMTIINGNGMSGKISLLLFQAIMFAGTAFVDIKYLRDAGFSSRKAARKAYFQKARVLYDVDYEIDRVSLVQALLLMTYWYETPDDQKDTWHWMGVAISLAHTIGLHRNTEDANMEPQKKKLWKRIWWSCFMRDRLVALGMRRPTRVKDGDYDVSMLTVDDFDIREHSLLIKIIPPECTLFRDVEAQRELAHMCVAKAKLCLCISHILEAQYSVLVKNQGVQGHEGSTRSNVMLIPKKEATEEVKQCDAELEAWVNDLPPSCRYTNEVAPGNSSSALFVQRTLLHMVYYTTVSALHRPQVLPATPNNQTNRSAVHDGSRRKVREAAREITRFSRDLNSRRLERYLPTTGVTCLIPAIIIHLLDIKSLDENERKGAMDGFLQCMLVLEKLRDNYASADFATQFLEAAIRKADMEPVLGSSREREAIRERGAMRETESSRRLDGYGTLNKVGKPTITASRRTPPFADDISRPLYATPDQSLQMNDIAARTPPETENSFDSMPLAGGDINLDGPLNFGDFVNFDHANGNDFFNDGAHGESGGAIEDMSWLNSWSRLNSPHPEDGLMDGMFVG